MDDFPGNDEGAEAVGNCIKDYGKCNRIVLDDVGTESYIENKKTGKKIPLKMGNGVYMMEMLAKPPFPRPAKKRVAAGMILRQHMRRP